jgi:ABC-type branched-subunit amino acid transport system ATPase component
LVPLAEEELDNQSVGTGVVLKVEDFSVAYGEVMAVDHVSLQLEEGQLAGLIGPNGAGKTSFIDGLTGLTAATGRVMLDGKRLDTLPAHRRARAGLGRTFQSVELFEDVSVFDNVLVAADPMRWWHSGRDLAWPRANRSAVQAAEWALEVVEASHLAGYTPNQLSLGQRKLVSVARSLAARPRVLMLDEPAAGLDTDESRFLGQALRRLVEHGSTLMLVEHDMSLVLGVCDVLHVLDFGRLIASGSPSAIQADQQVLDAYLGVQSPGQIDDITEVSAS